MYGTCLDGENGTDPESLGNMLMLTFTNVTAKTEILVNSTLNNMNLTVNVSSVNFSHTSIDLYQPQIPLPESLLQSLLEDTVRSQLPTLNTVLRKTPFHIPENFARLLDKPQITTKQQPQCCRGYVHGESDDAV